MIESFGPLIGAGIVTRGIMDRAGSGYVQPFTFEWMSRLVFEKLRSDMKT